MHEIKQLEILLGTRLANNNLEILPLHSDIIIDQQKRVFFMSKPTYRKVIISTSIAESSITVPDIKYVIDFCLTKELWCDPYTNYTHLRVEWTSLSSIEQRKGRAGRVSNGTCYRLINRAFKEKLSVETVPEIHRAPLTKLILNVKRLKQGEPKRLLS
jgi:ATP-dependent RNA helicase TDRD9